MYIVIFTSFLALFLTYLESYKNLNGGMKWGFIFLSFLGCIHYDYGNDYMNYLDIYNYFTSTPFSFSLFQTETFKDPGWVMICYLFKNIGGFFMMVAVLNIVQNILVYRTIKYYVEKQWWPISIFFYAFYTSLYLLSFSMMRQSFVICVFLGVWPLIQKRKYILSLIILFFCSTVHASSLLLLPFAFVGFIPVRLSKFLGMVLMSFYMAIWLGGNFINDVFSSFMGVEQFGKYGDSYEVSRGEVNFGLGFLLNQIPFVLSLLYLFADKKNKLQSEMSVVLVSSMGFMIAPFASIIPIVLRVGMYFFAYQIIAIPIIYSQIRNKIVQYATLFILIFMTLYMYFSFFTDPTWSLKYTEFKTIFSVLFV